MAYSHPLRQNPLIRRNQRDRDTNAGQFHHGIHPGDPREGPAITLPPKDVCRHLVLKDLDNLLHALDGLQVRSPLDPLPFVPQFVWGDDLEQHARMLPAADRGVGNPGRVALPVTGGSATADFRTLLRMTAQAVVKLASEIIEDDAMFGAGRGVRHDRAADELITPSRPELGLDRATDWFGPRCPCRHAAANRTGLPRQRPRWVTD